MYRPEYITEQDIERWNQVLLKNSDIPLSKIPSIILELSYAGFWISEFLEKLNCDPVLITRIQFTAGKYSFGKDIWKAHDEILQLFINGELSFEEEFNQLN